MSVGIGITRDEIERLQDPIIEREVAETVLQDLNKAELYNLDNLQDLKLYFVDSNDGERAVVVLDFGQENNLVAIYTEEGNVYEYVTELDLFYQVNDIQFLPITTQNKNAIIVNEYINQGLGAYEFSELIRGYVLEDGVYRQVLNVEVDVESYWNRGWENPDEETPDQWEEVRQTTIPKWNIDAKGNPILHLTKEQSFWEAKGNESKTVPLKEEFTQTESRTIQEEYFWSDDWMRFILGEAIDKTTQEVVAIIEIRDNSPYALAGFVDNTFVVVNDAGEEYLIEGNNLLQIQRTIEH
ncbi:hypothetical protein [Chakrabartyella piscis]|uniref:hypothetical protein n=1 Tax=Chakrabartyella piscis TaxID=2918914 RepID=UPI0029583AAC|nr:hypothetical protein [Chakrabartyella piscis]